MMSKKTAGIVALAVVGLAAASAWTVRGYVKTPTQGRAAIPAASHSPAGAERGAVVQALRDEVAALRRQLRRVEDSKAAAAPAQERPQERSREALDQAAADPNAPFVARLQTEARDADWAPRMEQRIAQTMQHESLQTSRLRSIECRSTVCVATVEHDNADAQAVFSDRFTFQGPKNSELSFVPFGDETEGYGTTCYLARRGHPATYTIGSGNTSAETAAAMHIPAMFRGKPAMVMPDDDEP